MKGCTSKNQLPTETTRSFFHFCLPLATKCSSQPAISSSLRDLQPNYTLKMLRKAAIQTSRSVRSSRRQHYVLPKGNSSRQPQLKLSDCYEVRSLSSLPLHSFQSHDNSILPIRKDDDDNNGNSHGNLQLLQPISLLSHRSTQPESKQLPTRHNSITRRQYHTTPTPQRGAAIVLTLGAVAATAKAGQYIVQGYKEFKEASEAAAKEEEERRAKLKAQGIDPDAEEKKRQEEASKNNANEETAESSSGGGGTEKKAEEGKRENIFAKFFNLSVGSKFYEGEFCPHAFFRKKASLD